MVTINVTKTPSLSNNAFKAINFQQEYTVTAEEGDNIIIRFNSSCNKPGIEYKWPPGSRNVTSADNCTDNPYFVRTDSEFRLDNIRSGNTRITVNVSHPLLWEEFVFSINGKYI